MGTPRNTTLCTLVALACVSCTGDNGATSEKSTLPASKACYSLLQGEAAGQLEKLTGLEGFSEYRSEAVEPFSSQLRRLEEVPEGGKERELCRLIVDIGKSREKSMILSVYFWWSSATVTRPHPETTRKIKSGELTLYSLGARGEAYNDSAVIYFHCSNSESARDRKVLRAGLWTTNTKLTGQAGRSARITILNAAARKIARQLNCLDTANLPETFHKISDPQRSPKNG
ncbi:hypothetical protein [Streptomyces netropsis]|uniref:Lipoprotein n=1 Tax=Streptomyces netropsis TaxID=55404 RepID=A0A7W7LJ91_STRNE|nr:hypothetical protein [Streptomyces netropsis]MBB4890698.1 hypothetical protein [Streptomyces netropsis]GGR50472.1 hypothetical protein GCM10010219_64660 [Streptomyces netropsis]